MGYGLAGAIGAAFAGHDRVLHVEGDGGFAQNLQELGTIAAQKLNVKTFLLCNDGYASIRMTQKSYFDGHYVGCDVSTGLGLPNWKKLFEAYGIAVTEIDPKNPFSTEVVNSLNQKGPHAYLVPVDPSQTYFPKITSFITESGSMQSNPLHLMTPELDAEVAQEVLRFLPK
jgi:acetolactate synthase-1/2/3 large subunit